MLRYLETFYSDLCDGDWEHQYGIKIETLDNPGWYVVVDLEETSLCDHDNTSKRIERSEEDWVHFSVTSNKFTASGGSRNLVEIISGFRNWVNSGELPI